MLLRTICLLLYTKFFASLIIISFPLMRSEDRGSTVVKVLCYKSEGRRFDSRWCHGIFH